MNKKNTLSGKEKGARDLQNLFKYKSTANSFTRTVPEADLTVRLLDIDKLKDAPDEWNFFKPLPSNRYQMLKDSIAKEGLLHPIYAWEYENNYIIISGHNRRNIFKELYEETGDEKYKYIPAKIETVIELDEERAEALVAIGNLQRAISANEEFITYWKIFNLNQNRLNIESKMKNYKKIEEATGKSLSLIMRILNLINVIPEIREMVGGNNPISIVASQRLVGFTEIQQKWLYDNFKNKLNTKSVNKLNPDMTRDEIRSHFKELSELKKIHKKRKALYIPKEIEEEFDKMVRELISKWEEENGIKWKL